MLQCVLVSAALDLASGLGRYRGIMSARMFTSQERNNGLTTRSGLPGTTETFLNSSRFAVSIAFRYILAYRGVLPRRRTWLGEVELRVSTDR